MQHLEVAKALYRMDVPASFFLIVGLTRYAGRRLLTAEPRLVKQVREMGHEIGSHTFSHPDLTTLDGRGVARECDLSKRALDAILGSEEDGYGVAYPYGAYNSDVIDVVKRFFVYGRGMGRENRWNTRPDSYRVGGMGIRHLPKYPFERLKVNPFLTVVVFHLEPVAIVKSVVRFLKATGCDILPLREALEDRLA